MNWDWLDELLDGIDKEVAEYDNGWWATSYGAEFGAKKMAQLKDEISNRYTDKPFGPRTAAKIIRRPEPSISPEPPRDSAGTSKSNRFKESH